MCFSATASALFGALVSAGIYTFAKSTRSNSAWLTFAAFPHAFGIQQGFEGLVWLGIQVGNNAMVSIASRGFLFFSHFFCLAWVLFSVRMIDLTSQVSV